MKKIEVEKNSAYLVTDRVLRFYFCDTDIAEGYLIITDKGHTVFTDSRYFYQAKIDLRKKDVNCELFTSLNDIKAFLTKEKIQKLKLDYTTTTMSEYISYKEFGFPIEDGKKDFDKVRAVKSNDELVKIKKACNICENAYHKAIKTVHEGMTETELRDTIEKNIISLGGEGTSFETIVAFGEGSAVPHHVTGNTKLKKNQPILVDMGAKYMGYMSDMTRMAYFGKPDKKFLSSYKEVLTSATLAIERITSGTKTDVADGYARNYLKEKGLDKYFTHSLGHGVGVEIHEHPYLSPRKQDTLKNGMVFSIEPGVYFDGEFGIRIEDTVLLINDKVERLFTDSKELIIIK